MTSATITGNKGMRRAIATFALLGALATPGFVLATSSSATTGGNTGAGNSGSPPGKEQAGDVGAQNGTGAASGAFGAYAHGGIPNTYAPHDRATDGYQTGLNNSAVAGNRQGNLP